MSRDSVLQAASLVGDAQLVVMCGISGSGKTRFARELERCGYTRLSYDNAMWQRYGEAMSTMPLSEQRPAFEAVAAETAETLRRLLAEGRRVVLDSTMCRRTKRDEMRRVAKESGADLCLVWTDAPLEVLRERLSHRHGAGPDDLIVPEANLEMFYRNFERPAADEEFVRVGDAL